MNADKIPDYPPAESPDRGATIEEIIADYIDQLNSGRKLNPKRILAEYPAFGHEIIESLHGFLDLHQESQEEPGIALDTLGDYTLRRRIGRGGMGVVYDAWENSMDRRVALKVLPAGVAADARACARFLREAQAAGKLHHQNIVGVYSTGVKEGTPWYSMEYVHGETLREILAELKAVEDRPAEKAETSGRKTLFGTSSENMMYFGRLAEAFAGVAEGLQHAHAKGIIHRDIKPSNVILDGDGRLRILDFGLARLEGRESLTVSGDFFGTPLYMSPEQARQFTVRVDHRTDVYSLGATMYEVLTLRPPFKGKDHQDTLSRIVERDPIDPAKLNPRVPKDLQTIVLKCLRKDPGERYGTSEALAQDLARFVEGEPIEAKPEGAWTRLARRVRRHRSRLIATVMAVAAIAVVAWMALSRSRAEYERELALYPGKLREAVGRLDSGAWVLRFAPYPLPAPGIDIRVFEPDDFRDVIELAGTRTIHEAIAELRELTRACPGEPEAYYHLGRAYAVTGRPRLAVEALDQTLKVDPAFVAAEILRGELVGDAARKAEAETSPEEDRPLWLTSRYRAGMLRVSGKHREAEEVLSDLIRRLEQSEPPYSGFLTECYLERAKARMAIGHYDLAAEDCVRARASNTASLASELLLGMVYLSAHKPEVAQHTFTRLRSRYESLDVLPFWIVSVYLSVPGSDATGALRWAQSVRDEALRERLTTYLNLRLARWDDAIATGKRAIEADPDGLVPRQLLAAALIEKVSRAGKDSAGAFVALAEACREAFERDTGNLRSHYLVRAAWETLDRLSRTGEPRAEGLEQARRILSGAARAGGLALPSGAHGEEMVDDFQADPNIRDGRPFSWRVIDECCPGEVEAGAGGLRITKLNPEGGHDAWLVTEEVFSDKVTVQIRADAGEDRVSCNIHVDLGTASLYYAGVSRNGKCEIGKIEYGEKRAEKLGNVGSLTGDVFLELRSNGDIIESRVWPAGSDRPEAPTLQMADTALRLGSIGISTSSHPASFRWVRAYRNISTCKEKP